MGGAGHLFKMDEGDFLFCLARGFSFNLHEVITTKPVSMLAVHVQMEVL